MNIGEELFTHYQSFKLVFCSMAFCTNCGTEIKKSWKHCPTCGQTVIKKDESSNKPLIPDQTNPLVKFKQLPKKGVKDELKKADTKNLTLNPDLGIKKAKEMKILAVVFFLILVLMVLLANRNQNSESSINQQTQDANETNVKSQYAQELSRDKGSFFKSLSSFKSSNCEPKFYRGDKSRTADWDMELKGVGGIEDFPSKYAFNQDRQKDWQTWGNQVDKALIVIASYEYRMSDLYWYIFDLYKNDGMGAYRSSFNQFYGALNKMAQNLCYQDEPTASQYELAQKLMPEIDNLRGDIEMWLTEASERRNEIREGLSAEVQDFLTPKCTETKTNIPGYSIIKCTNLR